MGARKPDSQTRNPPRTRRFSTCYLHQTDPTTGICAACLRERLHGLDSPEPSFPNAGGGGPEEATARSPELRRCRSVYTAKCEGSASSMEPRRKSCDVRARNGKMLAHLFDADDECVGSNGRRAKVESKNILRSPAFQPAAQEALDRVGVGVRVFDCEEEGGSVAEEGEVKTMKEYIDLEMQSKVQKIKLAGNLWEAASVFSKKLQKWKHKQKRKTMGNEGDIKGRHEEQSDSMEFGMRRRSCDTDPRFSVDAGRMSFDEPRASWDGYMIARTIPRLAPMLSVVENAILNSGSKYEGHRLSVDGGGQMHSIIEDESSSGGSAQSQSNSDSSSSQRRSSFDRSSSVRSFGRKFVGLEGEGANAGCSPKKLVITEKELKDWHLKSIKDDHHKQKMVESPIGKKIDEGGKGHSGSKKQVGWRKMWNVFGFKQKGSENKLEKSSSMVDSLERDSTPEKQAGNGGGVAIDGHEWKLLRSNSIVGARRSCDVMRSSSSLANRAGECEANKGNGEFVLARNQSVKYTSRSDLDDLPFYLTPLRTSRSRKAGRSNLQNSHILSLN